MADVISNLIPPALADGEATPGPVKQKFADIGGGAHALVVAVDASDLAGEVAVVTDATLTGDGTTGNPLSVVASGGSGVPLSGGCDSVSAGTTMYFPVVNTAATGAGSFGSDPTDLTNGSVQDVYVFSVAGTLSDLRSYCNSAPTGAETYILTVYKNGAAQAITCTYTGADTTKNDLVNTMAIAEGDRVAMRITASAGSPGTQFAWGLKFVPS